MAVWTLNKGVFQRLLASGLWLKGPVISRWLYDIRRIFYCFAAGCPPKLLTFWYGPYMVELLATNTRHGVSKLRITSDNHSQRLIAENEISVLL